jgi:hypothetical protein
MSLYDIDIKELTDNVVISSDNEVSGSGIFDTLMVTVSKHIEAQYREGRILGTEYSNVYLGALQAVLDLSTKILLEKDLIAKQAEEIDSRINVNNKQIEKLTSDIVIAEEQSAKDLLLKDKQTEKLTSDIANDLARTNAEVALKGSQKALTDQQLLTEIQNTAQVTAQTSLITAQTIKINSDMTIAEEQSEKDLLLKDAQISKLATEGANDTQRTANDTARTTAEASLKGSQKALADQQLLTEIQTTAQVTAQTGLITAQTELATAQTSKVASDEVIAEEQSAKDLLLKDAQISKLASEETNDTQRTANDTSRTTADVSLKGSQKTLVDQQKLTEVQNTLLVTEQKNKVVSDIIIAEEQSAKDLLIKDGQIGKVDYEISNLLPAQKELIMGQTTNEGKKGNLIDYQRHGLKVDATYKNVKSLLDTWTIYYSITPGDTNLLNAIKKPSLDSTVSSLSTAISQFPSV